jgi:hyaluronoglucosaminidase
MDTELGIIEGFYGRPWTARERRETISFLAPHGYGFYMYAPKADPYLRRRWQEEHPRAAADELAKLSSHCVDEGVRFGVGISPYEIYLDFNEAARRALARKLSFFDAVGVRDLAILFDDMRGDTPGLAGVQAEIVEWAAGRTNADRVIVCPSYYSDDPVLDRVFGERPDGYVERLGELIDPAIQIFWTGPEVCSRELSTVHLQRVTEQLRRPPFLWDNYPVNDGQRMSQYLHVRAFVGRNGDIAPHVAAHGINPALQPTLTRIPALSLVDCYRLGSEYDYADAFLRAARAVLGDTLAARLHEDVLFLQDLGLDRLGEKEALLRERYRDTDHDAAREIITWLDGGYRITDEIVRTQ